VEVTLVSGARTVPEDVRALAESKIGKLGKLTPVLEHAEVRFSDDPKAPLGSRNVCEVKIDGHGHTLRAKASARDPATSVDRVVDKLEHQVERLKGKLVGRSQPRRHGFSGRSDAS